MKERTRCVWAVWVARRTYSLEGEAERFGCCSNFFLLHAAVGCCVGFCILLQPDVPSYRTATLSLSSSSSSSLLLLCHDVKLGFASASTAWHHSQLLASVRAARTASPILFFFFPFLLFLPSFSSLLIFPSQVYRGRHPDSGAQH